MKTYDFQSRKFALTLMGFIVSTIMVYTNKADFNSWANFNQWTFGMYATSNVIQKMNINNIMNNDNNK
jgi:hypothetical protein